MASLPDLPPKLRYPFIVEYLVERHLLAQAAVKEGVADSEDYKRRLALYQAKALRDAYFAQTILPTVTEEEMKKAYDSESAKMAQTERVRARHILVATEQEAKQIRRPAEQRRKIRGSGEAVQSRRLQGIWWRSRLFHCPRNGGGIL